MQGRISYEAHTIIFDPKGMTLDVATR
jgi:hypothetical protein